MPNLRDEAVCIRRWDFSETSQTVSLFCREHGLLRGIAKGAKREKSQFSGGIELLTRGEVLALVRKGRDLATLTDWNLLEVFPALSARLDAHRAGLYMVDLIQHLLHEGDPHTRLFDELVEALRGLAEPRMSSRAVLRFQWALLVEAGYKPILDRDAHSGAVLPQQEGSLAFSAEAGGTVEAGADAGAWRVRLATVDLLRKLEEGAESGPPAVIDAVEERSGDDESVQRASRLLAAYLRHLMGQELATMRHLFGPIQGR